jgi:hypothetical protein
MIKLILCFFFLSFAEDWQSFNYREMGLTQLEYQKVLASGIKRSKLEHLLELGIKPNTYFKKPWLRLGMTEEEWVLERSQGMSDEDFYVSYQGSKKNNAQTWVNLALPGYYQWKNNQFDRAAFYSGTAIGSLSAYLYLDAQNQNSQPIPWLLVYSANALLSFFDARISLMHNIPVPQKNLEDSNSSVKLIVSYVYAF